MFLTAVPCLVALRLWSMAAAWSLSVCKPEPDLVRRLWALLPLSTRCERWPSSFAFGNKHRFDIAVVPRAPEAEFVDYVVEAAAGDYPEGRYELALQTAVEHDQQDDLTKLFFSPQQRSNPPPGVLARGQSSSSRPC